MLQYHIFFRQFGIRKVGQLMSPPLPVLDRLYLPKSSLLHYPGEGLLDDGPTSDEFLFRNIGRPILLTNVTTIGDNKGTPRRLSIPVDPLIRSFHIKNRRYRKLVSIESIPKDPMTMIVVNYSFIPRLYRYMRSIYSEYYRWNNQQASIWKSMNTIASSSERNQFIMAKLPKRLPSISELKLASREMNQRSVKTFHETESLFILELWKWIGEDRQSSLLNLINRENYSKINIIFIESGRFAIVNLGVLDGWRSATKEELISFDDANEKGFSPIQFQKRFLRLLISLFNARTSEGLSENLGTDIKHPDDPVNQDTNMSVTIKKDDVDKEPKEEEDSEDYSKELELVDTSKREKVNYEEDDDEIEENFEEDLEIDKDLEQLEKMAQKASVEINFPNTNIDDDDDDGDDTEFQPDTEQELEKELVGSIVGNNTLLEDALMNVADIQAENGLISANEYRRYAELSKAYKTIVAPNGKTTLDKFINITNEDLKVPDNINMPDNDTVYDKTMLKSSLLVFDEHYVKNILSRDVASMVMNVQRAGIAVTDYQVERIESILGDVDQYTIKINPIEGTPSTIRFKLPVVDDEGVWTANGGRYSTRKQMGEVPIRKVSPDKIALTSYYGKTFVSRSSKKVNDYGRWIRDNVTTLNLDKESNTVKELNQSSEFDNRFLCPRIYSILAMEFKSFELTPNTYPRGIGLKKFQINLNHGKRLELYGAKNIKLYEKNGAIIIGNTNKNGLLIVDKLNAFYYVEGFPTDDTTKSVPNKLIPMGSIEDLLGLDLNKAPIDFADIKILGRQIPVGVILGYELGLTKLMKLLKLTPRRVPVGTRVNLIPSEYALVFNDETLVFSRDDTYASIILAGFNAYRKTIREFNVHEFDTNAVYFNLIESVGLSARFLREIESLYQLFIDPITRDLLIEMKEPTSFRGLLLRSCELLKYDQHPDEMDGRYARIKGYERFAGIVYTELTRAIRIHNSRTGKDRLPIDINPYQVWTAITTDRAKIQISDINPIENLKNQEAVTFIGSGGRTSRTMVKRNRVFDENNKGVISESTVDSSDTGVNVYTPANPLFTTVRGLTKPYDKNKDGLTSLVSTSAMLSPSVTKDDKSSFLN